MARLKLASFKGPTRRSQGSALARVEFYDLRLLEELRKVLALGQGDDLASELRVVGIHISWNRGAFIVVVASDPAAALPISNLDRVADLQQVARYVHRLAVHRHVPMADHLPALERRASVA